MSRVVLRMPCWSVLALPNPGCLLAAQSLWATEWRSQVVTGWVRRAANGAAFMVDEVQTGLMRTGTLVVVLPHRCTT